MGREQQGVRGKVTISCRGAGQMASRRSRWVKRLRVAPLPQAEAREGLHGVLPGLAPVRQAAGLHGHRGSSGPAGRTGHGQHHGQRQGRHNMGIQEEEALWLGQCRVFSFRRPAGPLRTQLMEDEVKPQHKQKKKWYFQILLEEILEIVLLFCDKLEMQQHKTIVPL